MTGRSHSSKKSHSKYEKLKPKQTGNEMEKSFASYEMSGPNELTSLQPHLIIGRGLPKTNETQVDATEDGASTDVRTDAIDQMECSRGVKRPGTDSEDSSDSNSSSSSSSTDSSCDSKSDCSDDESPSQTSKPIMNSPSLSDQYAQEERIYNLIYEHLDNTHHISVDNREKIFFAINKKRLMSVISNDIKNDINFLYIHSTKTYSGYKFDKNFDGNIHWQQIPSPFNIFAGYDVTSFSFSNIVVCHVILHQQITELYLENLSIDSILHSIYQNHHTFVFVTLSDEDLMENFSCFVHRVLKNSSRQKFVLMNFNSDSKKWLCQRGGTWKAITGRLKKRLRITKERADFLQLLKHTFNSDNAKKIVTDQSCLQASKMFPGIYNGIVESIRNGCLGSKGGQHSIAELWTQLKLLQNLQNAIILQNGSLKPPQQLVTKISIDGHTVKFFVNDRLHTSLEFKIITPVGVEEVIKSYLNYYLLDKRKKHTEELRFDVRDMPNVFDLINSESDLNNNFAVYFVKRTLNTLGERVKLIKTNAMLIEC